MADLRDYRDRKATGISAEPAWLFGTTPICTTPTMKLYALSRLYFLGFTLR